MDSNINNHVIVLLLYGWFVIWRLLLLLSLSYPEKNMAGSILHRIASRLGMQRGGLPRESIAALHELLDVDPVRAIAWGIQWSR